MYFLLIIVIFRSIESIVALAPVLLKRKKNSVPVSSLVVLSPMLYRLTSDFNLSTFITFSIYLTNLYYFELYIVILCPIM